MTASLFRDLHGAWHWLTGSPLLLSTAMGLRWALHSHAHRLAPVPTQKILRPEQKSPFVSLLLRVERHYWAHSDKGDLAEVPNWLLGPLCPAPGPVKTAQGRRGSGGLRGRWVPGSGRYIGTCPYHRALRMTCWGFLNTLTPMLWVMMPLSVSLFLVSGGRDPMLCCHWLRTHLPQRRQRPPRGVLARVCCD